MTSTDSNIFSIDTKPIFFNACFDKTQVKNLVSWYLSNYGERKTIKFLEKLKLNGFHQATLAGISLGIEDLQIPPDKPTLITQTQLENEQIDQFNKRGLLTSVEKSTYLIDIWNQTSDKLRQTAIQNFKLKNPINPVYMMAFSGARGNVSQVRQLIAMRGLMADPQGAILEFPIQSNFREGLTITEYLISCYGARKGLVDTALRTATSGYLTRRLVDSAQNAVVSVLDCQTQDYRILEGENLKSRLVGRVLAKPLEIAETTYFRNRVITQKDAILISKEHTQVCIRSPLTCAAQTTVCQSCYGWSLSSGKMVQIGEAVGVIAAQSIGEPGTQLTMRTFHTGGVGVFSDQALKPLIAPYSGKINFLCSLPGHFIRTPNGKIAFMVKYIPTEENKPLIELISNLNSVNFQITENQLPPGSILFVKQGEIVSSKTVLGQASYIKVTKQQLPESSHPVYSPETGQIFYESMNLVIEQQKIAVSDFNIPKSFHYLQVQNSENLGLSETKRMAQMGSFWILKNSEQQAIQINTSLALPGDLISTKTSLGSYSFISPYNQYLQLINNSLAFGIYTCQLKINSVFQKSNALIYRPSNKYLGIFIDYLNIKDKKVLIWYPNKSSSSLNVKQFNYINSFYIKKVSCKNSQNEILQGLNFTIDLHQKDTLNRKKGKVVKRTEKFVQYTTGLLTTNLIKKNNNFFPKSTNTTSKIWLVFIQNSKLQKINNQLLPNDFEQLNFSIPKYHCHVSAIESYKKPETSSLTKWYEPNELLTLSKFHSKPELNSNRNFITLPVSKLNSIQWYKILSTNHLKKSTRKGYKSLRPIVIQQCQENSSLPLKCLNKSIHKFLYIPESNSLSKQCKTGLKKINYPKPKIRFINKSKSGYFKSHQLTHLQLIFDQTNNSQYSHFTSNFKHLNQSFTRGLSIYAYYKSILQQTYNLKFQTFKNNFVLANSLFSTGNIYSKNIGEFLFSTTKDSKNRLCILNSTDLINLPLNNPLKTIQVGNLIRWGQEIELGTASVNSGQIIKNTSNGLILRLGTPILASTRGIIHVDHNDLIQKNQLIVTLKSRRLQTEDIVQGIPKIEQLFEARESQSGEVLSDTVHLRLRSAFVRELELLTTEHWSTAVDKSFLEAQNFLVENIETAYSNQGVKISEKHIEVIVRQMTSRVKILEPGETGLLPGELVQHTWIKKFNQRISQVGLREATYEPIVLGISKSVLQSDSFLLAASFQEVSRVLIKSSLSKKRDFLQGLHENVIVGQGIPAGTGLVSTKLLN
jgi:hypothetical protein